MGAHPWEGRPALLLATILAWLVAAAWWLAAAPSVLAARDVVRLADAAGDPGVLVVAALLSLAAWLGFGGLRTGHRHR